MPVGLYGSAVPLPAASFSACLRSQFGRTKALMASSPGMSIASVTGFTHCACQLAMESPVSNAALLHAPGGYRFHPTGGSSMHRARGNRPRRGYRRAWHCFVLCRSAIRFCCWRLLQFHMPSSACHRCIARIKTAARYLCRWGP